MNRFRVFVVACCVAHAWACDAGEAVCEVSFMQISTELARIQVPSGKSSMWHGVSYDDDAYSCLADAVTARIEVRLQEMLKSVALVYQTTGKTDSFILETFETPVGSGLDGVLGSQTWYLDDLRMAHSKRNLKVTAHDLQGWITFTRFAKGVDKYSCDWCSLANGLTELYLSKLRNLSRFDSPPLKCDRGYWKSGADHTATEGQLACYNVDPNVLTQEDVYDLVTKRNLAEYTEQHWCPFKHLRQLSFNRSYYAFSPESEAQLREAQAILQEKDRITGEDVTCDQCNKVVNEEAKSQKDAEVSLFDDVEYGASYMDLLSCALEISCSAVNDAIAFGRAHGTSGGAGWNQYTSCLAAARPVAP